MFEKTTPPIFVFLGPPGSGKGSQAKKLSKCLHIPHISTGDLMRAEATQNPTLLETLNKGLFIADDFILKLLFKRMQNKDCANGLILDGFPRNLAQSQALDQYVQNIDQLAFINVSLEDQTIIGRLTGRRTCSDCSKIYHTLYSPSSIEHQCDDCQGPLYIRKDDEESVILNRLQIFKREFEPMLSYYQNRSNWIDLPAKGSLEECFSNLMESLSEIVPHLTLNTTLTS